MVFILQRIWPDESTILPEEKARNAYHALLAVMSSSFHLLFLAMNEAKQTWGQCFMRFSRYKEFKSKNCMNLSILLRDSIFLVLFVDTKDQMHKTRLKTRFNKESLYQIACRTKLLKSVEILVEPFIIPCSCCHSWSKCGRGCGIWFSDSDKTCKLDSLGYRVSMFLL